MIRPLSDFHLDIIDDYVFQVVGPPRCSVFDETSGTCQNIFKHGEFCLSPTFYPVNLDHQDGKVLICIDFNKDEMKL